MSNLALTKLPGFLEHLPEGVHNFAVDTLALALSNTDPTTESVPPGSSTTACALANVTQISSYANLSSLQLTTSKRDYLPINVSVLIPNSITVTASDAVPPFRWVYIYNTSSTTPLNALIGHYDLGSSITLAQDDTFNLRFDIEEGFLTIGDFIASFSFFFPSWTRQHFGWESLFAIDWWAE